MRRILHMDMDAFFAAVELLRHPELEGKPVIVGGRGNPMQRGVVSTATYEARQHGVHSGMPLRTAYKRCPEVVFLPVDYPAYVVVSRKIKTILEEFAAVIEDVGIDEAYLDISHIDASAIEIGRAIKKRIKTVTGLTCSIGVGPNKLLAKIASDMEKPNGLTIITDNDITSSIWPLSVGKVWGIGPKTEAKLASLGVHTIGELAKLSIETLIVFFGESQGNYLYRAARGIDDSALITHWEPKSLGHEMTFQHDVNEASVLQAAFDRLINDVVTDMKRKHYKGKDVTVKLRYADFETHTHTMPLVRSTDEIEAIRQAASECLSQFELAKKVRLIGVRVGRLTKKPGSSAEHESPE